MYACVRLSIHAYAHTYIHTYIHVTYIHTYIHTCTPTHTHSTHHIIPYYTIPHHAAPYLRCRYICTITILICTGYTHRQTLTHTCIHIHACMPSCLPTYLPNSHLPTYIHIPMEVPVPELEREGRLGRPDSHFGPVLRQAPCVQRPSTAQKLLSLLCCVVVERTVLEVR